MSVRPPAPRVRVGPAAVAAVFGLAPVLHFLGLVLAGLGAFMTLPALVELAGGGDGHRGFLGAAAVTLFAGVSLVLAFSGEAMRVNLRQAVLTVILTWVAASFFGALPFVFAERPLSVTDAVFETVSGLTSTGSTVYVGLDDAPRGILLWRFLLIWLGGFGLVTFAVLVLPYLRIGGLQLFTIDLSARPGKFLPKTTEVVARIALIYGVLTLLGAVAFGAAGMATFDAVGHAMSALATGGFSSHDAGIGHFRSPAIEWVATLFMLIGAMPFVLFIYLLRGEPGPLLAESQVRLFLAVIAVGVLLLGVWRLETGAATVEQAFREAAFNVVSIISTTGFTSHDFTQWGGFASLLLFCAMLMGGCTGSTAGGLKMFRLYILLEALKAQVRRQIHPRGVFAVHYNRQPVPPPIVDAVVTYAFAYVATFWVLALGLALTGLTLEESLGASATSLSGAGPALGPRIGPCCTFAVLADASKWLMVLGMLAGRLEILLLLLPLTRSFWRT